MTSNPTPAAVHAYLERTGQLGTRVVPLTGDASDRRYFRVIPADRPSYVLAVHTAPFTFDTLPFVNVAELFTRMAAPVPRIIDHAGDLGVLALEDLGDVTLQAHLGMATPQEHTALYYEAIGLIELFQRRGRDFSGPEFVPYGVSFDVPKLTWEHDFFIKHFLEGYRGVTWAPGERDRLRTHLLGIAEALAAEPKVLCHRDFHSRNLMLHRGRLAVIDFQDARMGPDTYDLASLLRDSYVDISDEMIDVLLDRFLMLANRLDERDDFRVRFDLMSLQRNIKALGTFGYQTTARENPVYLQYMPRTLSHVRENLHKHARFAELAELLSGHLPELA
jgi:aminoglycoside/choline kinase family phosphotransferase